MMMFPYTCVKYNVSADEAEHDILAPVGITCHGHADSATNYVVDKRSDADATTDYVGGKCSDADSVTNLGTTSLTKGVNSAREDLRILKQVLGLYL
ncbi:hypothetical protein N7489_007498 [Penicillium chrysogenum]|uniref:Uncharacterized protein n=1 Tax=Penicillium chrysogenum TaxID=5076 RepID=A0ABQ8W9H2_PENCH|nr:uncharacterized protein N7489_007498 [Penicillium chrysogenum]KAJ5237407.1 hypothetical protein N7489_007498 [Penicillium chrysogenum]KAJ5256346.1 hypothetical protein N7505_011497 [Penicillium chrysogenum]KAJ5277366.1 hypothetical protein N7524_003519 [Penicillium chrysogenum]KAJ6151883.1 hypothetical protein N7497_006202 [Penicillium chrysogenum]